MLDFLQAHADAPKQTATMAELARAAGYQSFSAVNLHYGGLARRIASALDFHLPNEPHLQVLVHFMSPDRDHQHWRLAMRPGLLRALRAEGWVM